VAGDGLFRPPKSNGRVWPNGPVFGRTGNKVWLRLTIAGAVRLGLGCGPLTAQTPTPDTGHGT
jgi:hypothetical protein